MLNNSQALRGSCYAFKVLPLRLPERTTYFELSKNQGREHDMRRWTPATSHRESVPSILCPMQERKICWRSPAPTLLSSPAKLRSSWSISNELGNFQAEAEVRRRGPS